jgi:FG-GAP-like repeat
MRGSSAWSRATSTVRATWHGTGDGTFAPVVALASLPDPPWQAFVADINGDGMPDVVAQGNSLSGGSDSTVEVLLGKKPSGVGDVPHVFAPLATSGTTPLLLAVEAAPPGGKGTFVVQGPSDEVHLVPGACQ